MVPRPEGVRAILAGACRWISRLARPGDAEALARLRYEFRAGMDEAVLDPGRGLHWAEFRGPWQRIEMTTTTWTLTPELAGEGLVLRPWDEGLALQMGDWGERPFPYAGFNLGYLRDPESRAETLGYLQSQGQHRHFVACRAGIAVGRVSVNVEDPAGSYIWAVHVPPEREGEGIARAMLRVICRWLGETYPEREILLTTNTFAERAHRAYRAVGFEVAETRWQGDGSLSGALLTMTHAERKPIEGHIRFQNGRWEVRVYVMKLAQLS